ncbi:MAG TPA: twin-arginine translocase subunit TatC [Lacipirellulaceae bacterium]|nr:twin-arginine translocase subunit TatC [Lacipirellulaceae bacterium]
MHRQHNEDLFDHTKMTFGEHLDELRVALFKAVIALVIGVLISLTFAGKVVEYLETPLKDALENYYIRVDNTKFRENLKKEAKAGETAPADLDAAAKLFTKERIIPEQHWIYPAEIAKLLKGIAPGAVNDSALPKPPAEGEVTRDKLVKVPMYHYVEDDPRVRIIGLGVQDAFVVYIKAAIVVGIILSSPFVFYFLWHFVATGLYPHERRYVQVFLPFSMGLFLAGAALAFFVVFKFVLAFLFTFYDWMGLDPDPRITDWLSFVLILPLGFGASFQLPLVMLFLERIGMFTIATYMSNWRVSVLVISFIAAVLAPADPYSMLLMVAPLVGLYFFGVMLCKWMPRRGAPFATGLE